MAIHKHPGIEKIDVTLAKGLVAARCALGWTQEALSAASGISRATIAQLESGYSDPRLSTVEALAEAFGITPALLLLGALDIKSFATRQAATLANRTTPQFLRQLEFQLESRLIKDTGRAAEMIRDALRPQQSLTPTSLLLAAIFGVRQPEPGLQFGIDVGGTFTTASKP